MVLFFYGRGEGKCEKNYKKRKKMFSSVRELFDHFWSLVCRKRKMIRKCFGGKEKR